MANVQNQLDEHEQPKAVLLMDLWCFPFLEKIKRGEFQFKCPVQILHSEQWNPGLDTIFKSWDIQLDLLSKGKCKDKQENIVIRNIDHGSQIDMAITYLWLLNLAALGLGVWPDTDFNSEAY